MFELLLVIVIIGILASIAYPSFITALERAKVVKDMNNLRQIGLATLAFLNDNNDVIPPPGTPPSPPGAWPGTSSVPSLYPKYISARKVYQSPFDTRPPAETDTAPVSYGINANMYAPAPGINKSMASVVSPASTIFMAPNYSGDPTQTTSWLGTTTNAPNLPVGGTGETKGTQANGQQINALFCDAHIETMKFGPSTIVGTFQNTGSNQDTLDQKHWDPTK